jgi:hypothetical protein
MDSIYEFVPIVAAIFLLPVGVLKSRRFLFTASFPVLITACMVTLNLDGSSGAFNTMGGYFFMFGFVCFALSGRLKPENFISRETLGAIGVLFIALGLAGVMIV